MARAKKKIHYIYKTTCNVTNRYYIGMHSTNNIDDGYMGSGTRLRASIRKYGEDNHTKEILEYYDTRVLLVEAEILAITPDMVGDRNCMNLRGGGDGGFRDDEHMMKCSKAGKLAFNEKLKNDDEFRKRICNTLLENVKNAHKNGNVPYGISFLGKSHSEESKKLMSESSKGQGKGKNNSQYGKCWITNGTESKKIYKGDEIPNGWVLGRKMK